MTFNLLLKHHVTRHGLLSFFGHVLLLEFDIRVSLASAGFFRSGDTQLCDLAKLVEEPLQFLFSEALRQMTDIDDALGFNISSFNSKLIKSVLKERFRFRDFFFDTLFFICGFGYLDHMICNFKFIYL